MNGSPVNGHLNLPTAILPRPGSRPSLVAVRDRAVGCVPRYGVKLGRPHEVVGRLLDSLKSTSLLDNTIVLYTSDHGCHFKTRNAEYKRSCHDASIRVPTALSGPGFDGGGRIQNLVSLVDLPPTLLDAAGIDVPEAMPGRSILPLARKRSEESWPEEIFVQISESQTGRCIRTQRWKYSVRAPGNGHPVSMPSANDYADDFLYDLLADPWELTNLIGMPVFKGIVNDLRARFVRRMTAIGEKEPRFIDAPAADSFQRQVGYDEF
ncbi:MAG: sulfatase/phosphatase domain-containing protein [Opitutaceae bacterium]